VFRELFREEKEIEPAGLTSISPAGSNFCNCQQGQQMSIDR
jgi:hypothetical protein